MNVEKIWNNADWTNRAREIVNALRKFPKDSKIILVLRHSHRNEPVGSEKLHELKLTPQGHEIARKFGEELPEERPIRLYHSVVWRCQETAQDILEGFQKKSGKGEIKGSLKPLFFAGTSPKFFIEVFRDGSPIRFLYQWAAGHFSPEHIMSFQDYSKNAAKKIWNKLLNAPDNTIDIHVTHDIFLIALRYGWFGLPPTEEWVPFLGGFAFSIHDNMLNLFDSNQFLEMEAPYWWKNIKK
jgi:broad specificity phosphatase PhoE